MPGTARRRAARRPATLAGLDGDPHPDGAVIRHEHPGPPNRLVRNLVVGTLIGFVVAAYLGNIFLSVLVEEHPALFISLNAQNRNLALASGAMTAWSFYLIGFLRLLAPDPLFFLLGRWYGDAAIRWMERTAPSYGKILRRLESGFDRAQIPVVAFMPNNPVCLFAGASSMTWTAFLIANVLGTIIRLILIRAFSNVFEGPLGDLRGFITTYRWPILAISLVLVVLSVVSDMRGGRESIGELANLEEGIAEAEAELEAEAEVEGDPTP